MSGRARNFRKKDPQKDDDEEDLSEVNVNLITRQKNKTKNKVKERKTALISFEDDEGPVLSTQPTSNSTRTNGTSQIKNDVSQALSKGKAPHKAKLKLKNLAAFDEAVPDSYRPVAGEYTSARIMEMKAKAMLPSASRTQGNLYDESVDTSGFKLSGTFKPVSKTNEVSEVGVKQKAASKATSISKPVRDIDTNLEDQLHVPSAEIIKLAKMKRERLRSAHISPDYIPLGGVAGLADLENRLKSESSLLHLSSNIERSDSDDDDPNVRMAFVGKNKKNQGHDICDYELKNFNDESDKWIDQQLRNATGHSATSFHYTPNSQASHLVTSSKPMSLNDLELAAERAMSKLQQDISRLKNARTNLKKKLANTQANLNDSVSKVDQIDTNISALGEKYVYLQNLKAYIADLCDMLQAKAIVVEQLQDMALEAASQRSSAFKQSCDFYDQKEFEIAAASVTAALDNMSLGSNAAVRAAAEASKNILDGVGKTVPEYDEFGRDINLDVSSKESKLCKKLISKRSLLKDKTYDLYDDTTDESDGEIGQYEHTRKNIADTASHVFKDVDDDFGSIDAIIKKLEIWKSKYPDSYKQSYASENVAALFAPFIRNELVLWDPLYASAKDFDCQSWFITLMNYSEVLPSDLNTKDEDMLIPTLVENIVCPIAQHLVQVAFYVSQVALEM